MMALCGDRPWVVFLALTFLLTIWTLRIGWYDQLSTVLPWLGPSQHSQEYQQIANDFVQTAVDVEFPSPMDYAPIQEVCTRTWGNDSNFRPGLLFTCEGQHGGVGMVRNQILRCVRYAISAGAALVVPSMALRNAKDITDIETATEVPLEHILDRQTFVTHLSGACPGMQIYDRAEEFPSYAQRIDIDVLGNQFEPDHPTTGLTAPQDWRLEFDGYLTKQNITIDPNNPVHVKLGQSFLEYPARADGDAFYREFGKILSFRNDTRTLAAKVLFQLKQRFGLPIDPAKAINPNAYYGAHLRLEDDAIWAWPPEEWRFSRKEEQFAAQIGNIARTGLGVVYVASGNLTVVEEFEEAIKASDEIQQNVPVVTKYDLLDGADKKEMEEMPFDQQALVDFLVMFKASAFMGVAHSSFPWNVALRRHELSNYTEFANEGSDLLRDELSIIEGMAADYPHVDPFVYGIWP